MPMSLEKQQFFIHTPRIFVRDGMTAETLIHSTKLENAECESLMGDMVAGLERPENWSAEATEIFASAATLHALPQSAQPIEENTVPSWLWQHQGHRADATHETSADEVFRRVVGAATFKGWKQKLFKDEASARSFYEEARYALLQRFIAIEPQLLAQWGVDWAYGITKYSMGAAVPAPTSTTPSVTIANAEIDALVAGSAPAAMRKKWHHLKLSAQRPHQSIAFRDTDAEWNLNSSDHIMYASATIDLLHFRHEDGMTDVPKLRHAVRLISTLFDLLGDVTEYAFGTCNLAALLMADALAYDSTRGRAMAAALAAFVTAEAYAISSELAAMRGMSAHFVASREQVMRALRNHARAAMGDKNDYERVSVVPEALALQDCPDLALAAAAQNAWLKAVDTAHLHGLRNIAPTCLNHSANLILFVEALSSGVAPLHALTKLSGASEGYERTLLPSVGEALEHLKLTKADAHKIRQHIMGHLTLDKCPVINHTSLKAAGFDRDAIARIENYLPQVNNIRIAFTQWIVGENFCRNKLGISARKLQSATFDLLAHLGFNDEAIAHANLYIYGEDCVQSCGALSAKHRHVFTCLRDMSARAHIGMAAAVQSFIARSVIPDIALPAVASADYQSTLTLEAWRIGLRGLTFVRDVSLPPLMSPVLRDAQRDSRNGKVNGLSAKKLKTAFLMSSKPPALPTRGTRSKSGARISSLDKTSMSKSRGTSHATKRG